MSTPWIHIKNTSNPALLPFVEGDITYAVLHRILQRECTDIFYNDSSVIICYSAPPYPVWVWCKDAQNDEDIAKIAQCIKTHYPLEDGYNIILSYAVLERLKAHDAYFENVSFKMELLSYQLNEIHALSSVCNGMATLATVDDLPVITSIFKDMYYEMEELVFDDEEYEKKALQVIERQQLYTWRTRQGQIVCIATAKKEGKYGSIACVYTLPEERRKGYALHLVHTLSQTLLSEQIMPILYTNGNYVASNECYKKIGFVQVGRICNIKR